MFATEFSFFCVVINITVTFLVTVVTEVTSITMVTKITSLAMVAMVTQTHQKCFALRTLRILLNTVDPRVTTGLTYEQLGLRPKF